MRKTLLKPIVYVFLFLLINALKSYSQTQEINRSLPLLTIDNKQLETVIDSVETFSENCEKAGLKWLTFSINIQEIDFNTFQIVLTLVDCQGLHHILTSSDYKNKPLGFFEFNKQTFIVSGKDDFTNFFKVTNEKREFHSNLPKDLLMTDYSVWIYSFDSDRELKLFKFYPLCEPNGHQFFPACYEKK